MMKVVAIALVMLAGCVEMRQANYRVPRADELPPGATVPADPPPRAYVPLPTGEQLRAQQPQPYMMPVQPYQRPLQTTCHRSGNQVNCTTY